MSTPWLVIGLRSTWSCLSHLSVAQVIADSTHARQGQEKLSENIELSQDLRDHSFLVKAFYLAKFYNMVVHLQREYWLPLGSVFPLSSPNPYLIPSLFTVNIILGISHATLQDLYPVAAVIGQHEESCFLITLL